MSLGNLALAIFVFATGLYALLLIMGMIALFPEGIIGLVVLGIALFFIGSVTAQRLRNKEDRHYVENVKE
ncbi:MAG: hypothetical protein AAGH41_13450 [Pseudomonadota bacterium]